MARFRVAVEGRNVLRRGAAAEVRHGFAVDRIVEARSEDEAGERAMQHVWDDAALRAEIVNDDEDPPLLYLGEVTRLAEDEREKAIHAGWYRHGFVADPETPDHEDDHFVNPKAQRVNAVLALYENRPAAKSISWMRSLQESYIC